MIPLDTNLILSWVLGLMLPLTRILAFLVIAPIFGHKAIPKRVKIGLALVLTFIVSPMVGEVPTIDVMSLQGIFAIIEQIIIGLAIGFTVSLIFSGIEFAGQISGITMGLGFASLFDPQTRASSTVISQFFGVLALLVFLAINGHLIMISGLVESFNSMPLNSKYSINFQEIALYGSVVFSIGLQLSLPVVAALLITNLSLGVLTRTAPQLNLFGIGFPITLTIGFLILTVSLESMTTPIQKYIENGITQSLRIVGV